MVHPCRFATSRRAGASPPSAGRTEDSWCTLAASRRFPLEMRQQAVTEGTKDAADAVADVEVRVAVRHHPEAFIEVDEHDAVRRQRAELVGGGAVYDRARVNGAAAVRPRLNRSGPAAGGAEC